LDDWGSIPGRGNEGTGFFFLPFQTCSGAHPASYPMNTEGYFPGVERPGFEADHSSSSSAEFKNAWSYTSTFPCVYMAWCLVKHRQRLHGIVLI
jgi:hypothetical protein